MDAIKCSLWFIVLSLCLHIISCSSAGRVNASSSAAVEQVKVKQEPGTEDNYSCPTSLKTERSADSRSACMVGS